MFNSVEMSEKLVQIFKKLEIKFVYYKFSLGLDYLLGAFSGNETKGHFL